MFDECRQHLNSVRPYDELVMIGADVFRDASRVMKFAEVLFFKSDRKRFDALARLLAHQRDDGARVDAAGKKRAERDFRHQTHAHSFTQDLDRAFTRFFFADVDLLREVWLPVTLDLDVAVAPTQPMTGFEFANRAIRGQWRGNAHE